jgi:hypothetical protein
MDNSSTDNSFYPYAMVLSGSPEHIALLGLGWVETDKYPDGRVHLEPALKARRA